MLAFNFLYFIQSRLELEKESQEETSFSAAERSLAVTRLELQLEPEVIIFFSFSLLHVHYSSSLTFLKTATVSMVEQSCFSASVSVSVLLSSTLKGSNQLGELNAQHTGYQACIV